jgi:hypothetical protein
VTGPGNSQVSFHPVVHDERLRGGGEVWIELPEFTLHGVGDTPQEAWQDLIGEVRDYIVEYLEDPAFEVSPNRGPQKPHVLAARAADQAHNLEAVLRGEQV